MQRKLSSNSTLFTRYGAPALLALALLASTGVRLFVPMTPVPARPPFPPITQALVSVASIVICGYALYLSLRVSDVTLDGDRLIFSRWRRRVEVPLLQVESVQQEWWRPGVAEILLHRDTELGDRVLFLPMQSAAVPWVLSPTVRELRALVDQARSRRPTAHELASPTNYSAQWRYYFFWHRIFWLTLLTYFPGVFAVGYLLRPVLGENTAFPTAWGVWVVAFFVTTLKLRKWLCPRCRMPFFETGFGFPLPHPFVKVCRHCGLPRGRPVPRRPRPNQRMLIACR